MDWKSSLQQFLDANPGLPEGDAPEQPAVSAKPRSLGDIKVVVERKGHKGKTVTIAYGFTCDDATLASIASRLKQHLGTGGSARGGEILVQGDRRQQVIDFLDKLKMED